MVPLETKNNLELPSFLLYRGVSCISRTPPLPSKSSVMWACRKPVPHQQQVDQLQHWLFQRFYYSQSIQKLSLHLVIKVWFLLFPLLRSEQGWLASARITKGGLYWCIGSYRVHKKFKYKFVACDVTCVLTLPLDVSHTGRSEELARFHLHLGRSRRWFGYWIYLFDQFPWSL